MKTSYVVSRVRTVETKQNRSTDFDGETSFHVDMKGIAEPLLIFFGFTIPTRSQADFFLMVDNPERDNLERI